MKIPGLLLLRWSSEAQAELSGMTCKRILQPTRRGGVVLHFVGRRERFLLLPTGPETPALCWFDELSEPNELCGDLEASERFNRLHRRRLLELSGIAGDRRAVLRFGPRPEREDDRPVALVVHLIGALPLILLLDDAGTIQETSRPTERFPVGHSYVAPQAPALLDPLAMTFPQFLGAREAQPAQDIRELLCRRVWGFDEELAALFAGGNERLMAEVAPTLRNEWAVFSQLKVTLRRFLDSGQRLLADPESGGIAGLAPDQDSADACSANGLICRRLREHVRSSGRDREHERWRRYVTTQMAKVAAAQSALAARRDEAQNADQYRQWADILNIHRSQLQKGSAGVELPDPYHSDQQVRITLDPAKTVLQNIESYYRKHRRAQAAQSALGKEETRLGNIGRALHEIDDRVKDVDRDPAALPVAQWRITLQELGLTPPPETPSPRRVPPPPRLPYREFVLAGGEIVWVGRSARENDELTMARAAKSDWFLHAAQNAGAHVILKHGRSDAPPAQTLRRAAAVAAFFSEAKHSGVVPVSYTSVKYVRKPRKAPPGLVALIREETILVAPAPPPGYHDRGDSG